MEITDTKPDDHIKSLPDTVRDDVAALDKAIVKALGKTTRVLWEGTFWGGSKQAIIGYGHLTYTASTGKKVEWFLVGLAVQKGYISVYVNAVEHKTYLPEQFKDTIGKAKVGKSSIGFKKLTDIHLNVLMEMIKKAKALSKS